MRFIALLAVCGFTLGLHAQEGVQRETHAAATTSRHFRAVIVMSHTLIPVEHTGENLLIPSWGLDLEYWWSSRWGLGLHNDLEIESFIIEESEEEFIERSYPLVMTLDALFKPTGGLVLLIGPGIEVAPEGSFWLMRAGLEYEFELAHHWDLAPTIFYDTREDSFQTWSFGLGVGKRF